MLLNTRTLSVLRANESQVGVLADLLIALQRLSQSSLLLQFVLDLFGALQHLIGLSGRQTNQKYGNTN